MNVYFGSFADTAAWFVATSDAYGGALATAAWTQAGWRLVTTVATSRSDEPMSNRVRAWAAGAAKSAATQKAVAAAWRLSDRRTRVADYMRATDRNQLIWH